MIPQIHLEPKNVGWLIMVFENEYVVKFRTQLKVRGQAGRDGCVEAYVGVELCVACAVHIVDAP